MNSALRLEDINFKYSAKKADAFSKNVFGLKNVSLVISKGDFISVIGKNGSGKSTLVKLISRVLIGYSGNIYYKDRDILSLDRKEYSKNVSYLPQATAAFNEDLIVMEFLLLGRYAHKHFTDFRFSDEDRIVVEESIKQTSVSGLAWKRISELSGGEKQKVLITLALVQLDITRDLEGKILMIDEPLTYLDVNHQFEIFSILKKLVERDLTVIIVIHDLNLALRFSDKTVLMNNGEMIKFADSKEVITEDILREHFLIESKILDFEKNNFINYLPFL